MTPQEWIAHDPDPSAAAELAALAPDELTARFASSLTFGTAGLRGPMRAGPSGMNLAVVLRATWGLARVLHDHGLAGKSVFVGYDARHHSADFARATAEVLAAEGFSVTLWPEPLPTPVLAFAVRHTGAAAGVQITASHNPAADNGYKVYLDGGMQIVSPTDREIEAAIAEAPPADEIARAAVAPGDGHLLEAYLRCAAGVRRGSGPVRVALTALHGVGGAPAVAALHRAGIDDVHLVAEQFAPNPDFPTVSFPNPEESGATDLLLAQAAAVDADIAVALDPDADRCAVGIPDGGGWRMLSGDETGWLLGDYILAHAAPGAVVASTVVSSRMLAAIAQTRRARHVETLTGFKWLARAAGDELVYAYEEAIGHCVNPAAVRDKDGISAAVLCCDLVATAKARGRTVPALLDALARRYGVHVTSALTARTTDPDAVLAALRADPPRHLAGIAVAVTELPAADLLVLNGEGERGSIRVAVRPSGTEPKIKGYIEIRRDCDSDLTEARRAARRLSAAAESDVLPLLRRGKH